MRALSILPGRIFVVTWMLEESLYTDTVVSSLHMRENVHSVISLHLLLSSTLSLLLSFIKASTSFAMSQSFFASCIGGKFAERLLNHSDKNSSSSSSSCKNNNNLIVLVCKYPSPINLIRLERKHPWTGFNWFVVWWTFSVYSLVNFTDSFTSTLELTVYHWNNSRRIKH